MNTLQTETAIQVCEGLIAEHQAMDSYLVSLEDQLNLITLDDTLPLPEHESTQQLLDVINQEINTHFACEELALFPAVSPYHPMVLMEAEHEELVGLRDLLLTQFVNKQYLDFKKTSVEFIDYLRDHMARENGGIFPACEQSLSASEKEQVIDAMAQIRLRAKTEFVPAIIRPEKSFQPVTMDLEVIPDRPVMVSLLTEAKGLQIKHLTIKAGEGLPAYWTPKRLFVMCLQGEVVFTADPEKTMTLVRGQGVLVDPQLSHALKAQSDCHLLLMLQDV